MRATLSSRVSITLMLLDASPVTKTKRPSGLTAIPCGPAATGIVLSTVEPAVSTTLTVESLKLPTDGYGPAAAPPAASRLVRGDRATWAKLGGTMGP